ncbi:hypothetical protein QYF61_000282 [Mycteria americana]|uniref:Uncharacterized protein n=1 Tax=Mycteria americana TaxID=33587 RepID=A0AAN7S1E0_MYCAM|nr:hypothetical protein QYF61_000282 [Mycteria americana]
MRPEQHKQSRRLLDCIDDNFLVEVTEELMRRDALLDLILKIKEKLIGHVKAEGSPGFSNNEMVKFRILRGGKQAQSSITTLEFRRTSFSLLKDLVGRFPWEKALERRRVQGSWLIFKDHLLQVQEWSILMNRKSSKAETRTDVKDKKSFYKYISSKRKTRENVGLLLNGAGAPVTKDMERSVMLNVFLASVFTGKTGLQESEVSDTRRKVGTKEDLSLVKEYQGEDSSHSSPTPAWGPSHGRQSSTNFSNMSASHGLQFFMNCSSVGPFHRVQSFRSRLLQHGSPTGSQVLPADLLQSGFLPPQVHRFCQEPSPTWASHGVTASFGHIHLLWCGVLHRLQLDICSTIDLHGLQGDLVFTMGAGESLLWHLEHLLPLRVTSTFDNVWSCVVSRVTTMTQRNRLASNFINWRIPQTDKLNKLASSTNEQRRFGNGAIFRAARHNLSQTCIYWKSRGREKGEKERKREEERERKSITTLGSRNDDDRRGNPPVAKQPQFPQPLLRRLVLQTLHQLHCPSLATLQHLNVSLVVRGPKLNTVFEVQPHQCPVQGHDHFPTPAGHTISDTSQDAVGLLGHLGTLPAHIQLAVNQHPQVLFRRAAFQPLFPKPVVLHGVVVTQHLALLNLIQLTSPIDPACPAFLPSSRSTLPHNLVSSANLLRVHSIPLSRSLIKVVNRTSPNTEPWGTPLVTGRQLDLNPFTTTLWARPSRQFFTQRRVHSSKP